MALKKGDFIELDYTGRVKESGEVFDTTSEEVAKASGLYEENARFGPAIACLGAGQLLAGLDSRLIGRQPGKHRFDIPPEEAFGKKDAKLLKLIATSKFTKQGMTPMPGLRLNIDGMMGTIKTVTGGRTIVDFNHPLSGKELDYDVDVLRVVTAPKDKLVGMLKAELYQKTPKVTIADQKATIELEEKLPEGLVAEFIKKAESLIPELNGIQLKQ
jgi:FKBP-type peptidyl-prolyl cis-trans isomerase 2